MTPSFKIGRPGCSFKNGKLYSFSDRRVLVLSAGTDPRCWVKSKGNPSWHSSRKMMKELMKRLPLPQDDPQDVCDRVGENYVQVDGQISWPFGVPGHKKDTFELLRYQNQIPSEMLPRISQFPDRHWQIYNLLARVPGAIDLCDSNPALAYMLASNWVFHTPSVQNHLRAARRLVFLKQIHALE